MPLPGRPGPQVVLEMVESSQLQGLPVSRSVPVMAVSSHPPSSCFLGVFLFTHVLDSLRLAMVLPLALVKPLHPLAMLSTWHQLASQHRCFHLPSPPGSMTDLTMAAKCPRGDVLGLQTCSDVLILL